MKTLLACLLIILFFQSCRTKQEQNKELKLLFKNCDELSIIYYAKEDTFAFSTIDTSTIRIFVELISENNENLTDSCQTTQKLIYRNNGKEIFTALV